MAEFAFSTDENTCFVHSTFQVNHATSVHKDCVSVCDIREIISVAIENLAKEAKLVSLLQWDTFESGLYNSCNHFGEVVLYGQFLKLAEVTSSTVVLL